MKKSITLFLLIIFVLLLSWQVGEDYLSIGMMKNGDTSLEAFIPTPKTILESYINDGVFIFSELSITLFRALAGFTIGFIVALIIILLMYFFPIFRSIIMPFTFAVNSFPVIGFSPIIILLFGQGSNLAIIFVSALVSYFPILISLETASRDIKSQSVMELMRVLNASRYQILLMVILPNSVPYFLVAAKLAIPASIMGAVIGEWLGSNSGIGKLIILSFYQLKPGLLYASLFSVVFVSCLLVLLLNLLEKKYCFWKK